MIDVKTATKYPRVVAAADLLFLAGGQGSDAAIEVAVDAFNQAVERSMWKSHEPAPVPREAPPAAEASPEPEPVSEMLLVDDDLDTETHDDDAGEPDSILLSRAGVQHVYVAD